MRKRPLVLAVVAALAAACGSAATSVVDGRFPGGTSSPDAGTSTGDGAPPNASDASPPLDDASAPPALLDGAVDAAAPLGPLVAYASGYGPNIALFTLDASTGALTPSTTTAAFGASPSFLAINREVTHLYAVNEDATGQVGAYAIDPTTGALTFQGAVSSGGSGPPFVALDRSEAYVLVANYTDGSVSVLPVNADGSLASPSTTLSVGTNAHMFVTDLSNRFAFVPCLGSDYVAQFLFDASTGALTPNAVPHVSTATGAGPRHLAFHPNGKLAYLINETNSTLTEYTLDPTLGTLTEVQTVSTLPAGFTGTNTAAEVWVHPSGKWLLGSNRGDDSIVVFALDPASGEMSAPTFTKSGGTTPRDFTIDPTGAFVYAANEGSGNVASFTFDASSGTLAAAGAPVSVTMASFVGVVRLSL